MTMVTNQQGSATKHEATKHRRKGSEPKPRSFGEFRRKTHQNRLFDFRENYRIMDNQSRAIKRLDHANRELPRSTETRTDRSRCTGGRAHDSEHSGSLWEAREQPEGSAISAQSGKIAPNRTNRTLLIQSERSGKLGKPRTRNPLDKLHFGLGRSNLAPAGLRRHGGARGGQGRVRGSGGGSGGASLARTSSGSGSKEAAATAAAGELRDGGGGLQEVGGGRHKWLKMAAARGRGRTQLSAWARPGRPRLAEAATAAPRGGGDRWEGAPGHWESRRERSRAVAEQAEPVPTRARVPGVSAATTAAGELRDGGGRLQEAGGVPGVRPRAAAARGRSRTQLQLGLGLGGCSRPRRRRRRAGAAATGGKGCRGSVDGGGRVSRRRRRAGGCGNPARPGSAWAAAGGCGGAGDGGGRRG
ncbi:hypothetical protein ACMD2_23191 [Ananas comosus]|uniref:Uncharacterized protein n=1 Tax=Ananas comosus TaxID=4615 RepID=A0A199VKZ4_ANACO|nr:hypothetical protein ACMD2_23191 [Ananas comosus]